MEDEKLNEKQKNTDGVKQNADRETENVLKPSEQDLDEKQSSKAARYPNAEIMLEEIKGEYSVELNRENTISTKASSFITVIVAIITLYIPMVPFGKMRKFFSNNGGGMMILSVVFMVIMVFALVSFIVAFYFLLKGYGIKGHRRVSIDSLVNMSAQAPSDDVSLEAVKHGLVRHYHSILKGEPGEKGNYGINSECADAVRIGIIWTVIGFGLLSISTIALRIIIV